MNIPILAYISSFILFSWGVAHLFPTRSIVHNFGDISTDNKHIITMEWIIEGVALIFIAFLLAATTYFDRASSLAYVVYLITIVVLNAFSLVSLFTGFRNSFIAFKLCPFIFTGSSILIAIGMLMN